MTQMIKKCLFLSAAILPLVACDTMMPVGGPTAQETTDAAENPEDAAFEQILDDHWAFVLETNPTFATSLGVRDYDDRLDDPSLAAYEAGVAREKEFLSRLEAIGPENLSDDNALNHALLKLQLERSVEGAQYGGKYMIITNRAGPHMSLTRLPDRLPFYDDADYLSYQTRLEAMPDYLSAATERLRAGIAAGWVQPCAPMEGYEKSISTHLVDDVAQSTFMKPFDKKLDKISASDLATYRARAEATVREDVLPALRDFYTFYTEEYAPACRSEVGTSSMPGGRDYYAHRTKLFTTLDVTPDEVHDIGLAEVARIRAEMAEVRREAGFEGTLSEFITYLRSDPQFYPKTGEERMMAAARISKKMDGLLPELFTRFPRMPYGLKPIPEDIAEKTTTAYYMQPAGDGSRAGFYYVNLSKLNTRPLYELEALSLHEAVPGHHFQIALAQELDMPPFRRFGGFTAFVEGWGLYSERLGLEVGFYDTPYTNFGRLSYEMWRACRLVVDTGMHHKGWTRQQAIDYMLENSALSENNITTEVDRYITWPGQALAYKMGELKIRELRAMAEAELGADFDKRLFHDALLENGAVPLSVLETKMVDWVNEQKKSL